MRAALQTGALGYVAKQSASVELLTAVRRAMQGKRFVTPLFTGVLPETDVEDQTGGRREPASLTTRQREVLQLVAEGKTGKEIAATLGISKKTVEFHKPATRSQRAWSSTWQNLPNFKLNLCLIADRVIDRTIAARVAL